MEARNRLLEEWFNRLRTGQLKLPRFQRYEAWTHDLVSNLIENVLRGLPVGSALILQVGDKELFVSRKLVGTPEPTERTTEHLLDGQQRLTALWKSFHDLYEDRTYFVKFEQDQNHVDNEILKVDGQARWEKEKKLYPLWADKPNEIYDKQYIPLKLLRPRDIIKEITLWCKQAVNGDNDKMNELKDKIIKLRERVIKFNLPFLSLPPGTSKDIALDVFIKLNTNSVRLTTFDILVAQGEEKTGQSLHDLVNSLKKKVPRVEEYTDSSNLVLSTAAFLEDKSPTQASFLNLNLEKLMEDWENIENGIKFTISFLEQESIFDSNRLPTYIVLPVISALHNFLPDALDKRGNTITLIRKYLWRSFLTKRYENSSTTRSLQDFRGLRDKLIAFEKEVYIPIFDEKECPLPSIDEIKKARWAKVNDILSRGILNVSLRCGAVDIADNTRINKEHIKNREYHHLFPDSLLINDGGLKNDESYKAINCILITWNTNRNISAKEPLKYLEERVMQSTLGEKEIIERLKTHIVPYEYLNVGGYDNIKNVEEKKLKIKQDYYTFIDKRAEQIHKAIVNLCNGLDWRGEII